MSISSFVLAMTAIVIRPVSIAARHLNGAASTAASPKPSGDRWCDLTERTCVQNELARRYGAGFDR